MTIYKCDNCQKEFNRKSTYDTHLSRKNPCKLDTSIDNQCSYCDKIYTTKFNLNKHLKSCVKKILEDDKQEQINELKKLLFEHQKKLEELSKEKETNNQKSDGVIPSSNITVNDNSTNTNNNIVNNTTNNT